MSWLVLLSLAPIAQAPPSPAPRQSFGPQTSTSAAASTPSATLDSPAQGANDPGVTRLEDVIVLGRRGSTSLTPEIELGETEIDALGAYDIGGVIDRISRNLGFANFPIVIVNGRRVLNTGDFTRFPPDALVRVESLPPQAGAIYGDDPSRRVLNIVLQPRFKSRDGLVRGARPTAGGRSSLAADLRQSEIHENTTRQFGLQVSRDTVLRAEERRAYLRDHPGAAGLTLRPPAESLGVNFSTTGAIGEWSSSLNALAGIQNSRFVSMSGNQAIETRQEVRNLATTGGLGGQVMGWSMRLALDGNVSNARQSGIADSRSRSQSGAASVGVDRTLMELPAGPLRTNLSGLLSYAQVVSDVDAIRSRLSTRNLDINGNLTIPLSRRRPPREAGAGSSWGDMSMTLGGRVRGLAGTSTRGEGVNLGLNWSPTQELRLNTQWSRSTEGPEDQQRLEPITFGPPMVIFDFLTGDSVEILPLVGGNPDLRPQTSDNFAVTASVGPYTSWRMSGAVSFARARSSDGISSLPAFTPEVEAAFPDRFTRDADGRLIRIDQRPINLDTNLSDSLSSSLNFSVPFSRTPSPDAGYLQLAISHTWQIRNLLTIHRGLPSMDRLAGDGGGLSRQQLSIQADGRYRKWGVNAAANWRSASRIRRDSGRNGPEDLKLGDFATVDLRLSYAFEPSASAGQAAPRSRRYDGLQLELAVENLLDARPEARLGDGRPAPGYGRDDQDPLGRIVRVTLSKRF